MPDNLILLNKYKMHGHEITFIESTGDNHTHNKTNFCCVVLVDGMVQGSASGYPSKKAAKAAAAAAAVESLCLV